MEEAASWAHGMRHGHEHGGGGGGGGSAAASLGGDCKDDKEGGAAASGAAGENRASRALVTQLLVRTFGGLSAEARASFGGGAHAWPEHAEHHEAQAAAQRTHAVASAADKATRGSGEAACPPHSRSHSPHDRDHNHDHDDAQGNGPNDTHHDPHHDPHSHPGHARGHGSQGHFSKDRPYASLPHGLSPGFVKPVRVPFDPAKPSAFRAAHAADRDGPPPPLSAQTARADLLMPFPSISRNRPLHGRKMPVVARSNGFLDALGPHQTPPAHGLGGSGGGAHGRVVGGAVLPGRARTLESLEPGLKQRLHGDDLARIDGAIMRGVAAMSRLGF